ncbi:MAG: bifunctional folylpolyglutamate synthase/dihydrofolate synthase [Bacteroidales bacterium]|nr:bifunctional folylpolyglutamate synthase/dihydrofolate synthase [Bacteroidales bacterium]
MNYDEVLEFMFNSLPMYQRIGKAAYKADLITTEKLDEHFRHPHRSFKTIHVAGTNGKGSVSHSIASVFQEAGYKTGLYTSPHLIDYRERIRVNGEMITKEFVIDFINESTELFKELEPSFFEMSVALAFEYFKFCKVDVAIIEVGMGGRLDSTNIITPELSIITNIGFDHTQFLGNSLDKIAIEKAGIIKRSIPVIIGETQAETSNAFINIAKEKKSKIIFADQNKNKINNKIEFGLTGSYQKKNLQTIISAIETLNEIGFTITNDNIIKGLKNVILNTGFRGRWEITGHNPLTICDTGHNKEGLTYTIKQLKELNKIKIRFVLGFVNDKNVEDVFTLFPKDAEYYFTKASVPRAMDENLLKETAEPFNLKGNSYPNVMSAYQQALADSSAGDVIFIGGSTFVVADYLEGMEKQLTQNI